MPRWRSRRVITATVIAAIFIAFFIVPSPPLWESSTDMCPVGGATQTHRTWFGVIRRAPLIHENALTQWLVNHGGHVHNFKFVFGSNSSGLREDGNAPAILSLSHYTDMLLANASDAEIAKLVDVLKNGTEDEQKAECHAAEDILFRDTPAKK